MIFSQNEMKHVNTLLLGVCEFTCFISFRKNLNLSEKFLRFQQSHNIYFLKELRLMALFLYLEVKQGAASLQGGCTQRPAALMSSMSR